MADVDIYSPNPVVLPEHASVRRRFRNYDKVDSRHHSRFDTRTLFYDIHLDAASNRLTGVGPAPLNLRLLLQCMSVRAGGRKLRWRVSSIKQLAFFRSQPLAETAGTSLSVEFRFKEFSQALNLPKSVPGIDDADADCPLTISTLQKDNHPVWIADWLKWHHRAHGVNRAVLYDNGSGNREELIDCLRKLELDMRIVFVNWGFPFGNRPTKSLQLGSLNHCRMRFAIRGGYCINNDVDEYLHLAQGDLLGYLRGKLSSPAPGAVMYQSVTIPNIVQGGSSPPRVFDFRFASIEKRRGDLKRLRRHFQNPKYIYSFDDIGYNGVHTTDSIRNLPFARRYSLGRIAKYLMRKMLREGYKSIRRYVGNFTYTRPRIDAVYADYYELCFLHFKGLSTGWRNHGEVPQLDYDPDVHKTEYRIRHIADLVADEEYRATNSFLKPSMRFGLVMLDKNFGGMQKAFVNYAAELAALGHPVLCVIRHGAAVEQLLRENRVHGIAAISNRFGFNDPFAVSAIARSLGGHFDDEGSCFAMTFGARATYFTGRSRSRGQRWKIVASLPNSINAKYYEKADILIPSTAKMANPDYHKGLVDPHFSEVIPRFSRVNPVSVVKRRGIIRNLFAAGRFVEKKGFHVLLQAVSEVRKEFPDIGLEIAGDGPQHDRLSQLINRLGLDAAVELTGFTYDVPGQMRRSDMVIVPSVHEPFGNILLEAMASGTPIVATRNDGALELLDNSTATLCDIGSSASLASAMMEAIRNPRQASERAAQALEVFRQNYTADAIMPRLMSVLEQLR